MAAVVLIVEPMVTSQYPNSTLPGQPVYGGSAGLPTGEAGEFTDKRAELAAGFGIAAATAWRHVTETVALPGAFWPAAALAVLIARGRGPAIR